MKQRQFFGTDGIRGEVGGPVINASFALRLGYASGRVFAQRQAGSPARPQVLIGKDTRVSGYMLESALEAGLTAAGVDVLLAGPLPTPAVAYLTRALRLTAGIVISASHNPYHDNGIKFFTQAGTKLPGETEEVIEAALWEPMGCVSSKHLGRVRRINDAPSRYIEFCKSTFPGNLDLTGLTLVVDAAHGACYYTAPEVFSELGAQVHTIGCEPDGFNINADTGAVYPQALVDEVRRRGADLGIALDGDGDRLVMVDGDGRIYNGDELLYALVRDRMESARVDGVVGTLMTNYGLEQRLSELDIDFERANVGDRYVLERLHARGWLYGGESSGHLLCLDRHTTGDGIIAALQIISALQRHRQTLPQWLADLRLFPQRMVNLSLPLRGSGEVDWSLDPALQSTRQDVESRLAGRGRVLIRASGTEPKLRLMVEAEDGDLAERCVALLAAAGGQATAHATL